MLINFLNLVFLICYQCGVVNCDNIFEDEFRHTYCYQSQKCVDSSFDPSDHWPLINYAPKRKMMIILGHWQDRLPNTLRNGERELLYVSRKRRIFPILPNKHLFYSNALYHARLGWMDNKKLMFQYLRVS